MTVNKTNRLALELKELEPLAEEARKYKSAEEFVMDMMLLGWIKQFPPYSNYDKLGDVDKAMIDLSLKDFKRELRASKNDLNEVGRQIRNYSNYYNSNVPDILTRPLQLTNLYNKEQREEQ
jgi:hypothetical protein